MCCIRRAMLSHDLLAFTNCAAAIQKAPNKCQATAQTIKKSTWSKVAARRRSRSGRALGESSRERGLLA